VKQTSFLHPSVFVSRTKKMGLGVFAKDNLDEGTLIETSPVIVMSAEDRKSIDQTLLHDYIFEWGEDLKSCAMALGYVPLYNHSYASNCEYEMEFKLQRISIKTVRPIKKGEELFINYNGDWDSEKKVWFETSSPGGSR
jgi:SET domain-containing protein